MEELKSILLAELARHPAMELQDAAKLIYQNVFGGGHLITDPERAKTWLREEMDSCEETDEPLVSPIGNGLVRLNLWPARGRLTADTLFSIFHLSSKPRGSIEELLPKLDLLYDLGFDRTDVDAFLEGYKKAGCPAMHHSQRYRAAYAPAYRVISGEYARWLDVYSAIERFSRFTGPIIVGIDGMCGSGKTTLGTTLAQVFDVNLFHADDYYCPNKLLTDDWMDRPGGNMDLERLNREVLEPLTRCQDVVTRRFQCETQDFGPWQEYPCKRLNVIEGSYSLHPDLADAYTLKVAVRTTPETQLARLTIREPVELGDFISTWIPLENNYHAATDLWSRADMVIDN